jgi:acetyltransferase
MGSLREEIAASSGPLPSRLAAKLLEAYGIPLVRSRFARSTSEATTLAAELGYPVALKISSPDIPHRSEVGGVALGIPDETSLGAAIERMLVSVRAYEREARIEGFELQEELCGWVEAMAGFTAATPFSPIAIIGTGGTMVELEADRVVSLTPFSPAKAQSMIARTRLGALLRGYRNLGRRPI